MDTTEDEALEWFLSRTGPSGLPPLMAEEVSQFSIDSFIGRLEEPHPARGSRGVLRLHGGHEPDGMVAVADVGSIAVAWQRAVTAVGGALRGSKGLRGALPLEVQARTVLLLSASPGRGSIVLHMEPKLTPLDDVEGAAMDNSGRPLVDASVAALLALLGDAVGGHTRQDHLSAQLRELGPRVGSALSSFARRLSLSGVSCECTWEEPGRHIARAGLTPDTATRLEGFVSGRGLDAQEEVISGVLRTISDRDRWLVQVGEDFERMDASAVPAHQTGRLRVGQEVELSVRVALREQPDGSTHRRVAVLEVVSAEPPRAAR